MPNVKVLKITLDHNAYYEAKSLAEYLGLEHKTLLQLGLEKARRMARHRGWSWGS
jgi:hypothetical protein